MKNKLISILTVICLMETLQIITGISWTVVEAILAGGFLYGVIYYKILDMEEKQ